MSDFAKDTNVPTNDCISRAAAIDAVDELLKLYAVNQTMSNVTSIQDILQQLPSAQPEPDTRLYSDGFGDGYKQAIKDAQSEIIRCKDCEDYQTDWETSTGLHYCSIIDTDMPPEGFCSNATRKGEQP